MPLDINWGLATLGPQNFENALERGLQMGTDLGSAVQEGRYRRAASDYATNPNDQSLNALARFDPQFVMAERQRQQEQQAHAAEQRRADLPLMGKLLDYAQDEGTYQQALQIAHQYGVDVSQLPPSYDPNWVAQQRQTVQLLSTPQGREALSAAGKQAVDEGFQPGTPPFAARVTQIWQAESTKFLATQPGGGVASIAPGQPAQFVIQPNDGSQAPGSPAAVPPLPPGFVLDNAGGGVGNGTGGFR